MLLYIRFTIGQAWHAREFRDSLAQTKYHCLQASYELQGWFSKPPFLHLCQWGALAHLLQILVPLGSPSPPAYTYNMRKGEVRK